MKLNLECIRAVMMEIEKSWQLETNHIGDIRMGYLDIRELYAALPEFDKKDIFYTLYNLDQAGFISISVDWCDDGVVSECVVNYMSFFGHQFLDKIRDTQNWSFIKKSLSAVRDYSLDAITALAEGFTNSAIKSVLQKIGS